MTADKKTLARLAKLIALATRNSEKEEARNSAVLACELIAEGKLVILLPSDPRLGGEAETENPFPGVAPPDPNDPIWNEVRRWSPRERPTGAALRPFNARASWLAMRSRYGGHCQSCLSAVEVGEFVYWAKDEGSIHSACFLQAMAGRRGR